MHNDSNARALLIKKLRYRSWHRGCKETDILLGQFCDHYIDDFDDEELEQFVEICEADDWDLYSWITRTTPLPEEHRHKKIFQLLMEFTLDKA